MTLFKKTLITCAILAATASSGSAQDAMAGHGMSGMGGDRALGAELPEICKTQDGMAGDMMMQMSPGMDPAHADLMAGMDVTSQQMMDAMMATDIDVAFVCGMIPHHQGAINMARAELEHGDNAWAKALAQKVIDAQMTEIAEMTAWLEGEGAAE
ncbi:DUF305 domain-containing protein [Devosia sp. FJ2-5-3]|jgi:uncharacterized protein (DUF305 family)|uniref:DUF305 domain-containing protein n=1 Tax=Devosia sp. FJ2-5-3 TaxID=2976680 RepID=UPI0023D8A5AC|nr:DUF305 domain-containing protein [Devosia sp. FJ2-5-3]WEJ56878.1 DUF305 domain-containing protein [Devosia sp. FJ2-5-3]